MKTVRKALPVSLFVALISTFSCNDEVDNPIPAIEFNSSQQNVNEGGTVIITLSLDKAAARNGSVSIAIESNSIYGQHFETNPVVKDGLIELQIEKGQKTAEFTVTSNNNDVFDNGKMITFALTDPSRGLKTGTQSTSILTIIDDEGPSVVNFTSGAGVIKETDSNGIDLQVMFSVPAKGTGSLVLKLTSTAAVYSKDFITSPEASGDVITLNILPGETSASFKVFPIHNFKSAQNSQILFSISNVSGVMLIGSSLNYSLTIINEDVESLVNFSTNAGTLYESNTAGIDIQVILSEPTKGAGTIVISINSPIAVYGKDFITSPEATGNTITLNILPNESGASFKVLPIHNFIATQNLQISFSIASVDGLMSKGTSLNYSLTLINEDVESIVNFASNDGTLYENNIAGINVEIPFSAQAPGEGSITISFTYVGPGNGDYNLTTSPSTTYSDQYHNKGTIVLGVVKGQTSASFKIIPIANTYCNFERHLQCKISYAFGAVGKGTKLDYDLELIDDEEPVYVNFAESSGMVSEGNSSGIIVNLNLSRPAINVDGMVYISGPYSGVYGSVYVTNPEMFEDYYYYGGYLSLPVKNATGISFTTFPINTITDNTDYVLHFTVDAYSNSGCVRLGPNAAYTLTIVDDD